MQQTSPSATTASDDLVFSGAGSGCNADDEDECTPVVDPGAGAPRHPFNPQYYMSHCDSLGSAERRQCYPFPGDDLITPVFVPPTRSPTGPARPGVGGKSGSISGGASGKPVCDDEDCFVGSGSGEITVPEDNNVSTTPGKGTLGTRF